jgi:hypothetical protein
MKKAKGARKKYPLRSVASHYTYMWNLRPVIVNGKCRWALHYAKLEDGEAFWSQVFGDFASVGKAKAAIRHINMPAINIPIKHPLIPGAGL